MVMYVKPLQKTAATGEVNTAVSVTMSVQFTRQSVTILTTEYILVPRCDTTSEFTVLTSLTFFRLDR